MRKYYTIFDYEQAKIGFIESKGYDGDIDPVIDLEWKFILVIIVILIFAGFLMYLIRKLMKRNHQRGFSSVIVTTSTQPKKTDIITSEENEAYQALNSSEYTNPV